MAAQDYYGVVQQLYVSYFGRPADYFGLQNFAQQLDAMDAPTEYGDLAAAVEAGDNAALTDLVNSFNNSAESIALYGNDNSQLGMSRFVAAIYQNVLGREADAEGFQFWVNALQTGAVTKANAAAAITAAAMVNTSEQGLRDAQTVQNKLDVATAFTDALDTPSEFNAYAGDAAAATARGLLQAVNADTSVEAYQANIDSAIASIVNVAVPGQTFAFTGGIDNLVGTAGNDTFTATINATTTAASLFGPLDSIDGGTGNDTLSIAVTGDLDALPAVSIKNVETLKVATTGNMGGAGAVDVSGIAFNTATLTAAGTTANVKVADTTDLTLTSAGTATVAGGKAVTVAAAGAINVSGAALTGVTVNGGAGSTINNTAASGNGTTLTSVTLNDVTGANTITGNGVTTVNLANIDTKGTTVAVTNTTTGGHTLNLNLNAVTAGSVAGEQIVVTDANATRVAITATGASNVALTAVAATAATVAGSVATTLNVAGSTKLASLDASAATGNVTVTGNTAALTSFKGGSGVDTISLGNATAAVKNTIDTGAGNDVVTLAGVLSAGSTINLGAGNDTLLGAAGLVAASTTTATTIIDGGEGYDSISAAMLNAANASQFRNFEAVDLSAAASLDMNLVTGSTITGLTLSGGAGGASLTNVKAGVALSVAGVNTGTTTIGVVNTPATDNVFGITFNGAAASAATKVANVDAGTVVVNGVETVTIASTGAANTWNKINLTDDVLQTLTITGDKNLDLTFASTGGLTAAGSVKMIDGSAATGALNINTTGLTAATATGGVANGGLMIKGGTAADTITLAGYATVDAGAGNDTIVVGSAGGILTGGAGNDTFDASLAVATGTTVATSLFTTITDLTAGDKIDLGAAAGATFGATKVALGEAVTNLDQALTQAATGTTAAVTWFQYGADTYVVADNGTEGFGAGDVVVKLTGLVDLSAATINADGIVTL